MLRRGLLVLVALITVVAAARGADDKPGLQLYFIDTEGGAATLIVTPAGESVLIDNGNAGARDAERIHKAATELAGLKAIDHQIITHWHSDHYGSTERLAKLLPIRNYYDRGIPDKLAEDPANFPTLIQAYKTASDNKSKTLKAGDELALKQTDGTPKLRLRCLVANGETVADKAGAAENPVAKAHKPKPEDTSDNARSLGFLLSYGDFRFVVLGDLTWNVEYKLVHPTDKVGKVDVFQVTHHGLDISNNPVLIDTIEPRVAVFTNGPRKGCEPSVTTTLRRVPGIEAIYQMHRNVQVGAQENTDPEFIANPDEKCAGESIRLAVAADGKSYSVTVGGKGKPKKFKVRGEG